MIPQLRQEFNDSITVRLKEPIDRHINKSEKNINLLIRFYRKYNYNYNKNNE